MKIVVVGAGEVGRYLCQTLSEAGNEVVVIESSESVAAEVDEEQDVRVIAGNGCSAETLYRAGVGDCDHFLALTGEDRTNLVACSLAHALGAKKITGRIHDQTYSDNSYVNYQVHFGIDFLLNPEALSAVEIAKTIRNPSRVAVENFARGQIEVQQLKVSSRSPYIGKSLKDISMDRQVRMAYIQEGDSFEVPTADTVIREGQFVTLVGATEKLYTIKTQIDPKVANDFLRVVIFGGTEIAVALIRMLSNPRFKVRVIENNPVVCRQLAERFSHVTIIQGSATSLRLMEEEQVGSADYFVACTKDDEDNIMTSLLAARIGARHVQLVINKPDYEHVLESLQLTLGVELVVSPRIATVNEVLRYLSPDPCIELARLPGNTAKILEVRVAIDSPIIGKTIREVAWPKGCVSVALQHKFEAKVPTADDKILAGDKMVVIVREDQRQALLALLT